MDFDTDNGILRRIPGQFLSRAMNQLPRPDGGQPNLITTDVDVPNIGLVRVSCKLSSSKHHNSRNWFWNAFHAERVEGEQDNGG